MVRSLPASQTRRGFSIRKLLVALVLVLSVPALGFALWSKLSFSKPDSGPILHTVERGDFVHEITDRGNVESADNVEIRCQVKSKGSGGTTILEIVPEGTMAKPGDVLVRLDSSVLENERTSQLIGCGNSEAALIQAQKTLDTAIISKREYLGGVFDQNEKTIKNESKREYLGGVFDQNEKTIKNEIFIAKEDVSRAVQYLEYSEKLAAKGYIPVQQLEADRFAVKKAENALKIAEIKLKVLQNFTKAKMIVQLESDIKTGEANVKAKQAAHKLDMGKLALIESQIEKCVIRSPEAGQVVYANLTGWRGNKELIIEPGAQIRERQVLIRLPNPSRMQVVAKINESKITLVDRGMPSSIRLDAFPDIELYGTVDKVNEFPVPNSFFGSSVKEYETVVRIGDSPPGLRPGLTAEVRICVEHLADVLTLPVQAVFEHGNKYYCVTRDGERWAARPIELGSTNDKLVVIRQGLADGEQVVLNAAAYRNKVDLPEILPKKPAAPPMKMAAPPMKPVDPSIKMAERPRNGHEGRPKPRAKP